MTPPSSDRMVRYYFEACSKLVRMKSRLRLLLTVLLLVALPLQGYAAGAMLFCGAASAGAQPTFINHAGHGHDDHVHAAATHDREALSFADETAPVDLAGLTHGSCSVCASCCSVAALPAATLMSAFGAEPAALTITSEQPAPEHAPARLERPPRTTLV